jgi:hypothetical protein
MRLVVRVPPAALTYRRSTHRNRRPSGAAISTVNASSRNIPPADAGADLTALPPSGAQFAQRIAAAATGSSDGANRISSDVPGDIAGSSSSNPPRPLLPQTTSANVPRNTAPGVDNNGNAISIQVPAGRFDLTNPANQTVAGRSRDLPTSADPFNPDNMAPALAKEGRTVSVEGRVVKVDYSSNGEPRTALVGNFNDIAAANPDLAKQVTEYLPQRSVLYNGRAPEAVGKVFGGADVSAIVVAPDGKPVGLANLTYQTAAFGKPSQNPDRGQSVENLRMGQVTFLAQVAGEKGGGSQATGFLHDITEVTGTPMVATTFPGANWDNAKNRSGLYGPQSPAGNPMPDFMIKWESPRTEAARTPTTQADQYGPGENSPVRADGRSIFAGAPDPPSLDSPSLKTDIRDATRAYYGWFKKPPGQTGETAEIPLFVYNDSRAGDANLPAGQTATGTRAYYVPLQRYGEGGGNEPGTPTNKPPNAVTLPP